MLIIETFISIYWNFRYIVILNAYTRETAGSTGGPGCAVGDIAMSLTLAAAIDNPVSQIFPYHIATIPVVFARSEAAILGAAIVSEGLPVAVEFFSAVMDEISSFGTSGRMPETIGEAILEDMKLKMHKFVEERTN